MKIGVAGPVSLKMLSSFVNHGEVMPEGYPFAPMAFWIEELMSRDHHVSVFTLSPGIVKPLIFTGERLTIHIGRYREKRRARDLFKQERQILVEAMQKDPVDVLHAHWTYEFALAALDTKYPTLITAHDAPLNILKIYRNPYRLVRWWMARLVCRHATKMTAVSTYIEKHYRQRMGYSKEMQVIPNGIPQFIFDLGKKKYLPTKTIFASNLTGWSTRKNGETLIYAFKQVCEKLPNCELWMFGNGYGQGEPAQIWAETHHLAKNIVFRGMIPYQDLMKELAEKVDILVHPALEESFSMAIAEAMALGIPVIGGKSSGAVPDTLGPGGFLVDIRSVNELSSAMLKLGNDQTLRKELGENGRNSAFERFRLEKVMDQFESVYRSLASSGIKDRNT